MDILNKIEHILDDSILELTYFIIEDSTVIERLIIFTLFDSDRKALHVKLRSVVLISLEDTSIRFLFRRNWLCYLRFSAF